MSQTWFGERERPITTALIGLSPVVGGLIGQGIAPVVMNDNPDNLPVLNAVITSPLIITAFLSWFVLKSAVPPTPPSRSAERLLAEEPPSFSQILRNLLKIIKNRSVLTIIVCQGSGSGLMNTLLTQLNQIMCSRDYTIQGKFIRKCIYHNGAYLVPKSE